MSETYYVYYTSEDDSDYEGFGTLDKAIEVANQWIEEFAGECEVGIARIKDGVDEVEGWSLWDNLEPLIVLNKVKVEP